MCNGIIIRFCSEHTLSMPRMGKVHTQQVWINVTCINSGHFAVFIYRDYILPFCRFLVAILPYAQKLSNEHCSTHLNGTGVP